MAQPSKAVQRKILQKEPAALAMMSPKELEVRVGALECERNNPEADKGFIDRRIILTKQALTKKRSEEKG